jgi:hypothetical protein
MDDPPQLSRYRLMFADASFMPPSGAVKEVKCVLGTGFATRKKASVD